MTTPIWCKQRVIHYEGVMLATVGEHGQEVAASNARCCVDGAMNALIRIEGPREAAVFAYAMADRAVAAIREPTQMPALLPAPVPQPIADQASAEPEPKPKSKPLRFWTILIAGWLIGIAHTLIATGWRP